MTARTDVGRAAVPTLPDAIPIQEIRQAAERIAARVLRTPLVRLEVADRAVYIKLENLQPIGSFKLRGASNAMLLADPETLRDGVWTVSAGNMGQGVAWCARALRVPCRVVVPDHAPAAKTQAVERLGGSIVRIPFTDWWEIMVTHQWSEARGLFVHPVSDRNVIAGNGTIGCEIAEDLPDVDTVLVPYGGGGLSCGIASALRALKPNAKVFAIEVDTAAPLAPSLAAGKPVAVTYTPSFVDGMGSRRVLDEMWPLARGLLAGSLVVTLAQVAEAVRTLAERAHVVAEGAGAAALAAACAGLAGDGNTVCVVSGGNIDAAKLVRILQGQVP